MKAPHVITKVGTYVALGAVIAFNTFFTKLIAKDFVSGVPSINKVYMGDSSVARKFLLNAQEAEIKLRSKVDQLQNAIPSEVSYTAKLPHYFGDAQKNIVQLFPSDAAAKYKFEASDEKSFTLIALDSNAKFQKIIAEKDKPTKVMQKNRQVFEYENIDFSYEGAKSEDGTVYRLYSITIVPTTIPNLTTTTLSFAPFDEFSISASKDMPWVGIDFSIVGAQEIKASQWYNDGTKIRNFDTTIASALHGKVYLRDPEDKTSNKFYDMSSDACNCAIYPTEFLLEIWPIKVKEEGKNYYKYYHYGWFLANDKTRTLVDNDRWFDARGSGYAVANSIYPPPMISGQVDKQDHIAFDQVKSYDFNERKTSLFFFGGNSQGQALSLNFARDSVRNIDTIDVSGIYAFKVSSGFPAIGHVPDTIYSSPVLTSNNFLWTIENNQKITMKFWDNERRIPTINYNFTSHGYAKDTTVYDFTSPYVIASSPKGGEENVSVKAKISVKFSEPMEPNSVINSIKVSYRVAPVDSSQQPGPVLPLNGSVSYSNADSTAIFNYSDSLFNSSTYTVSITGAKDLSNNAVDTSFSYVTEKGPISSVEATTDNHSIRAFYSFDNIYIKSDEPFETDAKAKIYDLYGRVVGEAQIPSGNTESRIPVGNLPDGAYFIRLKDREIHNFKIMKQ
ncbi:MAG: Ig-like domain-containing protein [Candidatus Micrarchaeia archaeon]